MIKKKKKKMEYKQLQKLMEIQYLKGRLDELYKGYVPYSVGHDNRVVDSRISKYENKLKETDEMAFYLYQVERENQRYSKHRSKKIIKELLELAIERPYDAETKKKIEKQLQRYV